MPLAALKSMLKERRIGYAALAAELDVSLLTVKRTLNKAGVPLDRLLDICRIAKIDFADLVERAAATKAEHTFFNEEQDELFTRCPLFRRSAIRSVACRHCGTVSSHVCIHDAIP
jgi:DNA-binding Xre family transcriptional regulator